MKDKLRLLLKPWSYGLRFRLILLTLFYWSDRHSFSDLTQNILDSNAVRHDVLAGAKACPDRFDVLRYAVEETRDLPGTIAEFGVFEGATLTFLAEATGPKTHVIGFDSFEGLPEPMGDFLPVGFFKTSVPEFPNKNIELQVGYFEETLPAFMTTQQPRFRLIHIDCDLYGATKFVLRHTLPALGLGGIIVFDEFYGYPQFEDLEYKAWLEIVAELGIRAEPLAYSSHSCAFRIMRS